MHSDHGHRRREISMEHRRDDSEYYSKSRLQRSCIRVTVFKDGSVTDKDEVSVEVVSLMASHAANQNLDMFICKGEESVTLTATG